MQFKTKITSTPLQIKIYSIHYFLQLSKIDRKFKLCIWQTLYNKSFIRYYIFTNWNIQLQKTLLYWTLSKKNIALRNFPLFIPEQCMQYKNRNCSFKMHALKVCLQSFIYIFLAVRLTISNSYFKWLTVLSEDCVHILNRKYLTLMLKLKKCMVIRPWDVLLCFVNMR